MRRVSVRWRRFRLDVPEEIALLLVIKLMLLLLHNANV